MSTIRSLAITTLLIALSTCQLWAQNGDRTRRGLRNPGNAIQQIHISPSSQAQVAGGVRGLSANSFTNAFDQEIENHFDEKNLPGLVVLYARDGLLTYQKTLGFADVQSQQKVTRNSVFRLASVSKWVAGILALKHEQTGNFNLNTKVSSYLPDIPSHHTYRAVDLLRCRSGVRHYGGATSPLSPNNWGNQKYDNAYGAAQQLWHDPLAGPVGDYLYSTHGYTILGACLESALNKPISSIVRTSLSNPYNLTTLRVEDRGITNANRVKLYQPVDKDDWSKGNVEATPDDISWKVLGGGLECSAMHLLQLGVLLCDNKIISKQNVERMMTRAEWDVSYAMGCNSAVENGYKVMAKDGGQLGVSSYIWMVPEKRMCMVVLTNRKEGGDASALGKRLRNIALGTHKVGSSKPDFIVESFKRTGSPRYNNGTLEIPFQIVVKNQGESGANTPFVNGVRLGTKYRWTGFMDPISKSSKRTASGMIKIPDANKLLAGRTLTLTAMADAPIAAADTSISSSARIQEAQESNNEKVLKIKVPGGLNTRLTNQGSPSTSGGPDPQRTPRRIRDRSPSRTRSLGK